MVGKNSKEGTVVKKASEKTKKKGWGREEGRKSERIKKLERKTPG